MRLAANKAPEGKNYLRVVSASCSAVNKMLNFLIGLGAANLGLLGIPACPACIT